MADCDGADGLYALNGAKSPASIIFFPRWRADEEKPPMPFNIHAPISVSDLLLIYHFLSVSFPLGVWVVFHQIVASGIHCKRVKDSNGGSGWSK